MEAYLVKTVSFAEETVTSRSTEGTIYKKHLDPDGKVTGRVLMLHGLGDHSGPHGWAATMLLDKGYAVDQFDWPGHGKSSGWRGDIPSVANAIDLIEETIESMESPPVGYYAHSTGAFILLHYFREKGFLKSGDTHPWVWLSSPLLQPGFNQAELKKKVAASVANLFPKLTFDTGTTRSKVCDVNAPDSKSRLSDFEGYHNRVSARFGSSLLEYEPRIGECAKAFPSNASVLLTQGDQDKICPPHFAFDFFLELSSQQKTLVVVKGARHEVFRESMRKSYWNTASSWLDMRSRISND